MNISVFFLDLCVNLLLLTSFTDALLADLQTTVTSPPGSLSRSSGYSSTLNGTASPSHLAKQTEHYDYNVEKTVS